jgi:sigma-E factor negative regulatory protein RseA
MIMDNLTMSMVKTMKTKNEHLSAVFDDEAGAFEQRRLLDELEKDGDLQQSWSNYALIGEVMREPAGTAAVDPDFLSSIQLRLDEEDTYSEVNIQETTSVKTPIRSRWLQPLSGMAIAATVAAISVFSMQSLMIADQSGAGATAQLASVNTTVATPVVAMSQSITPLAASKNIAASEGINLDEQAKMQRYLASHIRNASRKTIAPSLRMVSYNR